MSGIYADYTKAHIGLVFGLSGFQIVVLALSLLPIAWNASRGAWLSALIFVVLWLFIAAITIVPVRGRSATGWIIATLLFSLGGLLRWTRWRAKATYGAVEAPDEPDLPGVLQGIQIHDGPPSGATFTRIAIIQDHRAKTWAVTAAVVHPGIGLMEQENRLRNGNGLSELLDLAARTELIDEILILVRSVPDDGAERKQWVTRHRRSDGPLAVRQINDDIHEALSPSNVRTECFITIVVPESRLGRQAKESGGGVDGRARVMYGLAGEVESQLRGGLGMTSVTWQTSPDLALACRTGFAPGDRSAIIDALTEREDGKDTNAQVPWAMAGPSGADALARHYSHDAWNSISSTIKLPIKGAAMGALAPVLTPGEPGERRSFLVAYPILSQAKAERQSANSEWAADVGEGIRSQMKVKQKTKERDEADKVRRLDTKLARGNSLTRPYAVCTVTAPKTVAIAEYGRRLDASIRRAGFAPLRLDVAHDVAFAASTVPLGVSLTRRAD